MGDTEENATQEIDEKCTNLHITSPPAMGPDNPPGGMDTAKKSQKNDPSSQEYTKAKAMARKVYHVTIFFGHVNNLKCNRTCFSKRSSRMLYGCI